jgi:hypothetical protein
VETLKNGEIRVFAFEDGSFKSSSREELRRGGKAYLLGVLTRGFWIENLALTLITVDGLDGTAELLKLCEQYAGKFDLVMLASLAYAGFNIVDPEEICNRLRIPVVVVNPRKPRKEAVRKALMKHFKDWELRLKILEKTENPVKIKLNSSEAYISSFGIGIEKVEKIVNQLTVFGNRPEPLRIAKLIVKGLGFWNKHLSKRSKL